MNPTIDLLLHRTSVRDFKDEKLSPSEIEVLIEAAKAAPTASYMQAYSIISIDDRDLLEKLVEVGHLQSFILEAGHFFIFCGDFKRHAEVAKQKEVAISQAIESIDGLMIGAIDATLAAQNMVIAAEAMGLGSCYIGGVRDEIAVISDLLELPEYVFPVYGLAVGYPASRNPVKPRFQNAAIHHHNYYPKETLEEVEIFQETTKAYYAKRSKAMTWADIVFKALVNRPRLHMKAFLNKRGIGKH